MKKILLFILLFFSIVFLIVIVNILNVKNMAIETKKFNYEYEQYNKNVSGLELVSAINKAVNNNEKNNVIKNEKGRYIENDDNSILIQVKMILNEKTYDMEQIYALGSDKFISNFGEVSFNCTKVEYHKNGRISKMFFESTE